LVAMLCPPRDIVCQEWKARQREECGPKSLCY
jgi:hypothetical protein